MRRTFTSAPNEDRTFRMKFGSLNSEPMKLKLNKTSSALDIKTDTSSAPSEDTYYDEIIYYDGGGVDGYGD